MAGVVFSLDRPLEFITVAANFSITFSVLPLNASVETRRTSVAFWTGLMVAVEGASAFTVEINLTFVATAAAGLGLLQLILVSPSIFHK